MKQKLTLSLVAAFTLPAMAVTNAELETMLAEMQKEFKTYKMTQEKKYSALEAKLVSAQKKETLASKDTSSSKQTVVEPKEEVQTNIDLLDGLSDAVSTNTYVSFSDLGLAASKVYNSDTALSIGGYGEYKYKKYFDFKNYSNETNNETRNKSETNVVRFVPYIGFKFNDWIVMNTEIEFEDGGARSDDTLNYKYAIVEFSYIDFLFDEKYNLRVGHVLVPFGNINLNHEPVSFLTAERPFVETFIIPSTWHTNGVLLHGSYKDFEYYAGIITSPDAGEFTEGRFIQQGRLGVRQFTDDFSGVTRVDYIGMAGVEMGGSLLYGRSTVLAQDKPGDSINTLDADLSIFMAEAHFNYQDNGWNIQALASYGSLGDDYANLNTSTNTVSGSVNGQYVTVGYDLLHSLSTSHKLYGVVEIERLDMDADNETTNPDNYKFNEYTFGFAYYPDPKLVIKADYSIKDYAPNAELADEKAFIASLGFIF